MSDYLYKKKSGHIWRLIKPSYLDSIPNGQAEKKTMTATDVTGLDAIFSTGFFATFSRF